MQHTDSISLSLSLVGW